MPGTLSNYKSRSLAAGLRAKPKPKNKKVAASKKTLRSGIKTSDPADRAELLRNADRRKERQRRRNDTADRKELLRNADNRRKRRLRRRLRRNDTGDRAELLRSADRKRRRSRKKP